MSKLVDLEVERVDGVDEPATKQKFLILKAEEPDELRQNVKELLGKVEAALNALAKAEGLALTEEAASALNEVAKALGLELEFKAMHGHEEEYGYPAPERPQRVRRSEDIDVQELAKSVAAILMKEFTSQKTEEKPQSRQPQGQDIVKSTGRKLGEGLFTDIVFGR